MLKNNHWINALFALIFIATPALIIFYFLLPSWTGKQIISYGYIWLIALSFIAYSILLSFFLIFFEIISIDSLNFNIPITLSLMSLFVSYPLSLWLIFIIVIITILLAFPINIWTHRYKMRILNKNKKI